MLTMTILIVMGFWEVKIKSQPMPTAARPNTWEATVPTQNTSSDQVFLEDTTPRPINNFNGTDR